MEMLYNEALADLQETFTRALNFRRESWWAGFTTLSFAAFIYWQLGDLEPELFSKILLPISISLLLISGIALIWAGARLKLRPGVIWRERFNQALHMSIFEYWENIVGTNQALDEGASRGLLGVAFSNTKALDKAGRQQTQLLLLAGVGILVSATNSLLHFLSG